MRKLVCLLIAATWPGCSCNQNNNQMMMMGEDMTEQPPPPDLAVNPDAIAGGDLVVTPPEITLDVTQGMPAPTQIYVATTRGNMDVSSMATWTVDDTSLGTMSGPTFTANTVKGGTTYVHAEWMGLKGYATVHIRLHQVVTTDSCPGCPPFPPDTTPACTTMTALPTILYPPDGTLVPPNMNVMATQFDPGMGNTLFEIDYQNAVTDVRVETRCNAITDSKKNATNGCIYDLSQQVWDFLSITNRGGDPLNIIVRATDDTGSCISTSSSQIAISFGEEDLNGVLYYWQSVAVTGLQGATGGIFRYDFGKRGQMPDPFLAPNSTVSTKNLRCIGCHFLSRDGQKMTYGNDDPDADDEYGDLNTSLIDIATKNAVQAFQHVGGFQAFLPDHSLFLASNGTGSGTPNAFFLRDGNTAAAAVPPTVPVGARATHPDWSADGSKVVYAQPANFKLGTFNRVDDHHFTGASLYTMSYTAGAFGMPAQLLASTGGDNNYYPAFSPDGNFVIFNNVPLTGTAGGCTAGSCPNDAFSNPAARVMLMPAAGGTPVDLAKLNLGGKLTNSWPRFAPNTQMYKGHTIAWVTFSSTRDYGDVVRNSAKIGGVTQAICYPPESPQNASTNKNITTDPTCLQPQLWMTAIDLTAAATGADSSFPAFWLPFQDSTSHNHIAQWVTTLVQPPTPDGGAPDGGPVCIDDNTPCVVGVSNCCNGICCSDTHLCGCIP